MGSDKQQIVVIGGGAAGFFSAIRCASLRPDATVILLEKTTKLLSKVRVSGGGRCNVTHHCFDNNLLIRHYPRGQKELKQIFPQFSVQDTIDWFKAHGVALKTEADGRMFPVSNSSESIIDCFLRETQKLNIQIRTNAEVTGITPDGPNGLVLTLKDGSGIRAKAVICASGGHNQARAYQFLEKTGHTIEAPVPSLFTINLPKEPLTELMGLSVKEARVKVQGSGLNYTGPLLITHWGFSGPAVLKLSAFAAKEFFDMDYQAGILINWTGHQHEDQVREELLHLQANKGKALPFSNTLYDLPKRLWEFLLQKAGIHNEKIWAEIGKKEINRLAVLLSNDLYQMQGKTTFKEEFVTCGGVHLKEIDFKTMQSKRLPGLYFCGEVIDIDGITGGFNFQNAWSTAWIAAGAAASSL